MNLLSNVLWKSKKGLDAHDGEEIAFTDLDQNRGDDRDAEAALIKPSRHQCSVLLLWVTVLIHEKKMYISDQHPSFVFSPLSLNAKLVGNLYECLAPAEGEVRGCFPCALPEWECVSMWSLLVHDFLQRCHFKHPTNHLRLVVHALDQRLPFQNVVIHFLPAHLMLCAVKSVIFVLHLPFPETSLFLLPVGTPSVLIQTPHSLHRRV